MNINLETPSTELFFISYKSGKIKTNKGLYETSLIMSSQEIINSNWQPQTFKDINSESFSEILKLDFEIILLGTGENQKIPGNSTFKEFFKHGKSLDFMSSNAACRTFNILANEGRKVLAAIIVK
jgi:uncharacterized protein